jgi:hypothetical protein
VNIGNNTDLRVNRLLRREKKTTRCCGLWRTEVQPATPILSSGIKLMKERKTSIVFVDFTIAVRQTAPPPLSCSILHAVNLLGIGVSSFMKPHLTRTILKVTVARDGLYDHVKKGDLEFENSLVWVKNSPRYP